MYFNAAYCGTWKKIGAECDDLRIELRASKDLAELWFSQGKVAEAQELLSGI